MNTTVIICSSGRPTVLRDTVLSLSAQDIAPRKIILSIADDISVSAQTIEVQTVTLVVSQERGLTKQRNAAVPHVDTPYVLFIDDDVQLADNYICSMEAVFDSDLEVALATAHVVVDGAGSKGGVSRSEGLSAIKNYNGLFGVVPHNGTYGCNMFVRSSHLRRIAFDERLPLYGWLEDYDFYTQCLHYGKVVCNHKTCMVHLGTPGARNSGLRFGYSQIANPYYLWRKSGMPHLVNLIVNFWVRHLVSNTVHLVVPSSKKRADYKGRLRGNLLALRDLILFRLSPQNILQL